MTFPLRVFLALAVADSSRDYMGIFAVSTQRAVGMLPPPQRVDSAEGVDAKSSPVQCRGMLLFEVGHAAALIRCKRDIIFSVRTWM